ncbi:class I SAM-dependent methyltransferase [Leifsonia sp. NPDC058292]|uniref:class I SAM-dependent methyltransferase n=1 Tax=Leifsonia sp. NPDC058292 TaxID=3346428 RepID=UPI0036D7FCFC
MADDIFEDPRLAAIYDPLDPDRSDLDAYLSMVEEFGAASVLDIGCGTGTFACLLAARGIQVTGVDPARASLYIAQAKPGAELVRWVQGDATSLPPLQVDLAVMTANVAQVFVDDADLSATLSAARRAVQPLGHLVFEARDPSRRAWEEWTRDATFSRTDIPGVGVVEAWCELLDVAGQLVSFRWTHVFESDGAVITADSTLRFRERDEIAALVAESGFRVHDVRDAPDRPGREFVFVCQPAR